MTAPFVSVVLPVYNRSHSLGAAIDSVLAQEPPADELIVVDDGSEEDLSPLLARYDGRIVTYRQPNGGVAAARNAGARLARSRWLAFIDSDSEWAPGHVAALHRDLADAPPDIVLHLGDTRFRGQGYDTTMFTLKGRLDRYPPDRAVREDRPVTLLMSGMPPEGAAVRRDVFERIGGFDRTMRLGEDTAMLAQVIRQGGVLVTGQEMVTTFRLDDDPIALTGIEKREPVYARGIHVRNLESYLDLDLLPQERRVINGALSGARLKLALAQAATGEGSAWVTLVSAARIHPRPLVGWGKSLLAGVLGPRGYAVLLGRKSGLDRS